MNQEILERWANTLQSGEWVQLNDSEPNCILGTFMEILEDNFVTSHKLTRKQKIARRVRMWREKLGIKIGSKIAGYDLSPYDCEY